MLVLGTVTFYFLIPACRSLKEKRSIIKPLITRLQREFNISAAEIDKQDNWSETVIACALISNEKEILQKQFCQILGFIDKYCKDLQLLEYSTNIY
jgi:hypothetical protein